MSEQVPRILTIKTPGAWRIELDNDAWAVLLSALSKAIVLEVADGRSAGEDARQFRTLRTALSRADHIEGF